MSKRIYVPVSDEDHDSIVKMASDEQRDKAPMAAIILKEGLKARQQPESAQSYQQRIANEMLKKKEG